MLEILLVYLMNFKKLLEIKNFEILPSLLQQDFQTKGSKSKSKKSKKEPD